MLDFSGPKNSPIYYWQWFLFPGANTAQSCRLKFWQNCDQSTLCVEFPIARHQHVQLICIVLQHNKMCTVDLYCNVTQWGWFVQQGFEVPLAWKWSRAQIWRMRLRGGCVLPPGCLWYLCKWVPGWHLCAWEVGRWVPGVSGCVATWRWGPG